MNFKLTPFEKAIITFILGAILSVIIAKWLIEFLNSIFNSEFFSTYNDILPIGIGVLAALLFAIAGYQVETEPAPSSVVMTENEIEENKQQPIKWREINRYGLFLLITSGILVLFFNPLLSGVANLKFFGEGLTILQSLLPNAELAYSQNSDKTSIIINALNFIPQTIFLVLYMICVFAVTVLFPFNLFLVKNSLMEIIKLTLPMVLCLLGYISICIFIFLINLVLSIVPMGNNALVISLAISSMSIVLLVICLLSLLKSFLMAKATSSRSERFGESDVDTPQIN